MRVELAGRRVLVIEDEAIVSMLIEDALSDIGCVVVGHAARFEEGLHKAKTLAFDIAILDVNLAGERSYAIARLLQERRRPFVFATGYGATNIPEPLNKAPVLQKPFAPADLEVALRSALTAAANS